jgi:hypothetical protein
MVSLRKRVFDYLDSDDLERWDTPQVLYEKFPGENKQVLRQYFYQHRGIKKSNITIELTNIDTIKEMERTIQQIKDPVKRAENLARLHNMKLKPIANKEEKTLKEIFDAVD